uniref:Uncharacterized protein n=1 Tax=Avena sativa TaxID=4498 RepID=A0ACD6A5I7_AVESA
MVASCIYMPPYPCSSSRPYPYCHTHPNTERGINKLNWRTRASERAREMATTPTPAVRFSDLPKFLPGRISLETYWGQPVDASEGDLVVGALQNDKQQQDGILTNNPQAASVFYLERSKKHGRRLLHIRCGYNNKYWTADAAAKANGDDIVITNTASEREEDLGKPSCTLFAVQLKAKAGTDTYNARFYDPRQGKQAVILGPDVLGDGDKEIKHYDEFLASDMTAVVVLPRYVAFKGENGKYLSAGEVNGSPYLQFSGDDIAGSRVSFTTYHNHDGTVRLKSKSYNKFMRFDTNWIRPDGRDRVRDKDTLFKVLKVAGFYTLKSMGNQKFCRGLTRDGKTDCLNAAEPHITEHTMLWVVEPILSREIYNVVYHGVEKARVYDMKTITMATSSAVNRTSEDNNVKLSLTVTEKQTSTWSSSNTLTMGVKTTFTAGVPAVDSAEVEINVEVASKHKFGETEVKETKQEIVYDVVVPKMKKVTVSAIASQAKSDVPFSYTQKEVLPTGEARVTQHHDGLYTGMKTFNLQYETKEEDLPAPQ